MPRRTLLAVCLACLAVVLHAPVPLVAAEKPVVRLLRRLPAPGPVPLIQLLDQVTTHDLPASVQVRQRGGRSLAKLLFRADNIDVTVSGAQANWRGTVSVKVTIPCRISYAIDLNSLSAELVGGPERPLLKVRVPAAVEVVSVEPELSGLQVEESYSGCRFGFFDGNDARDVQTRLLREDYPECARERAQVQAADTARKQGAHELQQVLRQILASLDGGIEVVCE